MKRYRVEVEASYDGTRYTEYVSADYYSPDSILTFYRDGRNVISYNYWFSVAEVTDEQV